MKVLVSLFPNWSYCPLYLATLAACLLAIGSCFITHLRQGSAASTERRVKAPCPSLAPTPRLASQQLERLRCRLPLMKMMTLQGQPKTRREMNQNSSVKSS